MLGCLWSHRYSLADLGFEPLTPEDSAHYVLLPLISSPTLRRREKLLKLGQRSFIKSYFVSNLWVEVDGGFERLPCCLKLHVWCFATSAFSIIIKQITWFISCPHPDMQTYHVLAADMQTDVLCPGILIHGHIKPWASWLAGVLPS